MASSSKNVHLNIYFTVFSEHYIRFTYVVTKAEPTIYAHFG